MNIFGVISIRFRVVSKGQGTEFGFLKFHFFFFGGGGGVGGGVVLIFFEGKQ